MDTYSRHEISSESIELIAQDNWQNKDIKNTDHEESFDRGNSTRRLCLTALALSAALGIVCIALGASVFSAGKAAPVDGYSSRLPNFPHKWPRVYVSPVAGEILPLALNAIMTVCLDGLGFIHATTLRWALDQRLTFNANLRLFTSSRSCFALTWPANTLYAVLLILCYTSTSLFFTNRPPPDFCKSHDGLATLANSCGNDVHISPPALYCLGIGLLGQCVLVGWQFISVTVPTWSSNPLDTAWALVANGSRYRSLGRSMMSVHEASHESAPQHPKPSQLSVWKCHREARWIMRYIWLSLGLAVIFFAAIEGVIQANVARLNGIYCNGCGTYVGPNWNILPDYKGQGTSTAIITETSATVYGGMFIIIFLITGVVTMALHCAELITILIRDEVTWRRCNSNQPYLARQNSAIRAATSWQYIVLFVLKVVLHWISGKGVTYVYNWGIFLRPPQLLYLAIGMAIMAAFATYLALRGPPRPQPATFGHLQTLIDLVDEWTLLMFWGDKGLREEVDTIRHAGTANVPLEAVRLDALYE